MTYRVLWDIDRHHDFVHRADAEEFIGELMSQPTELVWSYIHVLDLSEQDRFGTYKRLGTGNRPTTEDWVRTEPGYVAHPDFPA